MGLHPLDASLLEDITDAVTTVAELTLIVYLLVRGVRRPVRAPALVLSR